MGWQGLGHRLRELKTLQWYLQTHLERCFLLGVAGAELTEGQEKELSKKLSFLNETAPPFAGKNVLEKLLKEKEGRLPLLDLLMCLEVRIADGDVAKHHLNRYLTALRESTRRVSDRSF